MIYAAIVGGILAAGHVALPLAAAIIVGAVLLKGLAQVALRKNIITGTPSAFVLYTENLERAGGVPTAPWRSYLMQMVFFGGLIGLAAFGLGSLIF